MKIIYYLSPSSFCFGVERAITELEKIIEKHPDETIYCIHELVHNPHVNQKFKDLNITFVDKVEEVPTKDAIIIFSAHGINREILHKAEEKFQKIYNLECPLVTKIYHEIDDFLKNNITHFLYIGKPGHQEAQNIIDYINYRGAKVESFLDKENMPNMGNKTFAVLSQTTLNFKKIEQIFIHIKKHYPQAIFPAISDICKATFKRQEVIHKHINKFKTLVVIGGKNSSNTKELVKIGKKENKKTFFAQDINDLLTQYNYDTLCQHDTIAITGGASTPDRDIRKVYEYYKNQGYEQKILSIK